MAESSDEQFEQRLNQIWRQGHKSMAAAFLRRAITLDSTLAEVAAALQFDQVRDFCESLRLADVLGELAAEAPPVRGAPPPEVAPPPRAARMVSAPAKPRRRRRGAEQLQQIKGELATMLADEPGSLDTTQMFEALGQKGHEVDRITLNRLLAQLEEEGEITCLGGRPKSWRQGGAEAKKSS